MSGLKLHNKNCTYWQDQDTCNCAASINQKLSENGEKKSAQAYQVIGALVELMEWTGSEDEKEIVRALDYFSNTNEYSKNFLPFKISPYAQLTTKSEECERLRGEVREVGKLATDKAKECGELAAKVEIFSAEIDRLTAAIETKMAEEGYNVTEESLEWWIEDNQPGRAVTRSKSSE